ncbi:hypothetical protein F66182_7588 [Fusarium sp. NRRL 66182]|nr:hypothetical protein F66182_7588 [Fusarium sp. NRRL 66182]
MGWRACHFSRQNDWRLKLGDSADSDHVEVYPNDWYGCEDRCCPPGSDKPQRHDVGTMHRELFALGSAICEILEWEVPYGSNAETVDGDITEALSTGKWPVLSVGNPAKAIIQQLWGYVYGSSRQVVHDLQALLLSYEQQLPLRNESQSSWSPYSPPCAVLSR